MALDVLRLNETNDENGCSGINFMWPDLENEKFKQALKLVSEGKEVNNICPIFTYSIENGATYMWIGGFGNRNATSILR